MKKIIFIFIIVVIANRLSAQRIVVNNLREETSRTIKKEADTTRWSWKSGGLFSFNLSQGSLSNWAAGGDNFSLAVSSYFNYYFFYQRSRLSWDNNIDFNFGYIETTSLGSRKNDDRLDLLSKYDYKIDTTGKWYLSALFNFRTQFFDGYTYPNSLPVFSSSFLSPAYVILSPGLEYKASEKFSIFMSPFTSRWVIVNNNYLAKLGSYGVDSGKHSINEIGAFVTINYNYDIAKNINYKSRLDLFSNYKNQPQNINFFMTNQFSCKINKYFSATYSLDLIYDDNVKLFGPKGNSPALQFKSLVGIGFLRNFNIRKKVEGEHHTIIPRF